MIITENSTEDGIMKETIKQKRTNALLLGLLLIGKKYFDVKWNPGHMNLGDYFTEHHKSTHHQGMQQTHLLNAIIAVQ